jgi:hypothetical protein
MKLDKSTDIYTLSTGKQFHASNGVLGTSPYYTHNNRPVICAAYASHAFRHHEEFTVEERQEIAKYMIDVWRNWALPTTYEKKKDERVERMLEKYEGDYRSAIAVLMIRLEGALDEMNKLKKEQK